MACSKSKLVLRLSLQNFAKFLNELTSLYQSPPPEYLSNANFKVGGENVKLENAVDKNNNTEKEKSLISMWDEKNAI